MSNLLPMAYKRGSLWRKWDLHIHTPASHSTRYGQDAWEAFFNDLRLLPQELSVIGISDYMWVDGYERVLAAHASGDLPNIEAIFPLIELRLSDFIGTDSHLARVNAHVLFAPGTDADLIRNQFIPRLVSSFSLTHKYEHLESAWNAIPTRDAVTELGRIIKSSVPQSELENFDSDFIEGFNNWVVPLPAVVDALRDSSFNEAPLLALGKTEWEDIPWNNQTIAMKKNLVSQADFLFTAAPSPAAWRRSVDRLRASQVNDRLLDCSDAHYGLLSNNKDRLGNCWTWLCADPTLAGLKHALIEYRGRVFIGEKPPLLIRQDTDPTNFVSRLSISPVNDSETPSPSFDVDVPINSGFVAIIGNKGSGKSAFLDSLALAGNSHSEKDFTFLSERRYRSPRNNKAPHYQVSLTTVDGRTEGPLSLSKAVNLDAPERIRYLPQSLLESMCNKEPGVPDDAFESELRAIIFSHVPEHERLGAKSLDDLLNKRVQALDREILHRRADLERMNRRIALLEERVRPSRIRTLRLSLKAITAQLANHDAAEPKEGVMPAPGVADASELGKVKQIRGQLGELASKEKSAQEEYGALRRRLDAADSLSREIQILQSWYADFADRATALAVEAGVDLSSLISLRVDLGPVQNVRAETTQRLRELGVLLGSKGSFEARRRSLQSELEQHEAMLDEPRRVFEEKRREREAWAQAREALVGHETQEGTQKFFMAQLADAEAVPEELEALRLERLSIARQIHTVLLEKVEMYRELYRPVQDFLDGNELARERFSLEFEANLEIKGFTDRFLTFIDRGASGSFHGREQSAERVQRRVKATDPSAWPSIETFIQEHDKDLRFDRRGSREPDPIDGPSDVLRKGVTVVELYNYLFGLAYIDTAYELRSDGRSIAELSPGQKGTILLMFYLLVDQSGRPIALDQPDENLDSQTIHTLLRPAIRAARSSRQVFVVTHSPNLAVVGDADQVIVASSDGIRFTYRSGSIENPKIRDFVVEVLEGTWPAFADRNRKYLTTKLSSPQAELTD